MSTFFKPVRGLETEILNNNPIDGYVWFAVDTQKIYYSNGQAFLQMGGSSSIFYGNKDTSDATEEQVEFIFAKNELESQETIRIDNLILNTDGCFYRVTAIDNDEISTKKLTIAGSGSSGGGSSDPSTPNLSEAKITYIGSNELTTMDGQECLINFNAVAKDRGGDETIGGTVKWYVDGMQKATSRFKNGNNSFDIGPYISNGNNVITGVFSVNVGTVKPVELEKVWNVESITAKLLWNYDFSKAVKSDTFNLTYTVLGNSKLQKTLYLNIDNKIEETKRVTTDREETWELNRELFGLDHGVHTISLYAKLKFSESFTYQTETISKKIMFIDNGVDEAPIIILVDNSNFTMQQYDTKEIPIMIYNPTSIYSKVTLYERENVSATWENVENEKVYTWLYTPYEQGAFVLTISCGTESASMVVDVTALQIDAVEPTGWELNIKANKFSGNSELINNELFSFSENFDWVNGGIQQEELDDGSSRQYICVKAGTEMTINYPLFKDFAEGKAIKAIFKVSKCSNYDASVIRCLSSGGAQGLAINAQNAIYYTNSTSTLSQYCEGQYIEYEIDVDKNNNRIIPWINGVPTGVTLITKDTILNQFNPFAPIIIGSPDCDVYLYCFKSYNKHLTDIQHLDNFILDAYNAKEIMTRYNRNNILNDSNEIDYKKVISQNPECYVQLFDVPRMTTAKKDKVSINSFALYKEDPNQFIFSVENTSAERASGKGAIIKVQGTSSEAYGVSAFNLDLDMTKKKITLPNRTEVSKVSIAEGDIPINYINTKVNVASCESANNALNADWYNKFQPYVCQAKKRDESRRDTMKFRPCVVFVKDNNSETSLKNADGQSVFIKSQGVVENVFKDANGTPVTNSYKMYAVGNVGNSKNNLDVFHDQTNPLELCVEVTDNQDPGQWMTKANGMWFEVVDGQKQRAYKDLTIEGIDSKENFDLWVNNLDDVDFAIRYVTKTTTDENGIIKYVGTKDIKDDDGNLNVSENQIRNFFRLVQWFAVNDVSPYDEQDHPHGYTNLKFTEEKHPENAVFEDDQWVVHFDDGYTFKKKDWKNDDTVLGNLKITQYQTGSDARPYYTHDTYEYRMAKMLSECEDYLIMDSIVYHYLFIERHSMVDNVCKNTFWSTEDGLHWNLVKDYDNDTADGNDNSGHMTLNYGIEALDIDPKTNIPYFNGYDSVWFHFINGIYDARRQMYQNRSNVGAWSAETYLSAFEDFQNCIPERCWIEDYYRKYIRPYDIYKDDSYLTRLEGGKKTEQRRQYETYQSYYMGTYYQTDDYVNASTAIMIRGNAKTDSVEDIVIPVKVYSDCYLITKWGQTIKTFKAKRNQTINIIPAHNNMTDETIYWFTPSLYTKIGDIGVLKPKIVTLGGAVRLSDFTLGNSETVNTELSAITFANNTLLKYLKVINCQGLGAFSSSDLDISVDGTYLDLSELTSLYELDTSSSKFSNIILPSGAPLTSIKLNDTKGLTMRHLKQINEFDMDSYDNLETVYLEDTDLSPNFNSYTIASNADNLKQYYFRDIDWKLMTSEDVQATDKTIPLLDSMLTKQPYDKVNNKLAEEADAMTGNITIGRDAYTGSEGIEFYNNYVTDDKYPNIDFTFEDESSKIYHIKVLNGDGSVVFKKTVSASTVINQAFFSSLNINSIRKASTIQYVYTFNESWKLQNGDVIESRVPYYDGILADDLTFTPQFDSAIATYSIDFLYTDNDFNSNRVIGDSKTIKHCANVPYGTSILDILPNEIPHLTEDGLALTRVYGFKGYYYNQSGTAKVNDTYLIASNSSFYAVFEEKSVYDNVIDDKYIDFVEGTYTPQLGAKAGQVIEGYYIVPKDEYTLTGKVTFPIQHEGAPVLGIHAVDDLDSRIQREDYNFGGSVLPGKYYATGTFGRQEITHIFWEQETDLKAMQVYDIGANAFGRHPEDATQLYRARLKYFEPIKTIEHFGNYAFYKQTALQLTQLPENLLVIDDYACAELCSARLVNIGNHVKRIGGFAFAGLTFGKDEALNIGDSVEYIGQSAFHHYGWAFSLIEPDYELIVNSGTRQDFKTIFIGKNIKVIGASAFEGRNLNSESISTLKDIYIDTLESSVNADSSDSFQIAGKNSYELNQWGAPLATIHWIDG